ncbi:Uncharacterised protein [Mycobacteroides abscessus subsp. abscessus]|nr:Uncharacterised protein [Mycobacteroides abscessus subsp. abscessus]
MGCLVGDCGGNGRVGGADGGHRDACSEVDEGVAVGVDDHAAIGVDGIDRRGGAHTRRHRGAAALGQCTGPGSRQRRHDGALLGEAIGDVGHGAPCRRSGDLSVPLKCHGWNRRFVYQAASDMPFCRPPAHLPTCPPTRRVSRLLVALCVTERRVDDWCAHSLSGGVSMVSNSPRKKAG